MRLKALRDSNIVELNERANVLVASCGYEQRSSAISGLITKPQMKTALCFKEWPSALARHKNEEILRERGFDLKTVGGNESDRVQQIVANIAEPAFSSGNALAFDISAMTRAWHGAIVRQLHTMDASGQAETFFTYVPGKFRPPSRRSFPNEFVGPVDGFASLSTPDLPVAAIIGLGYEKERALGLQQLLDPERTMLMVPMHGEQDPYYREIRQSNKSILSKTPTDWIFHYSLSEPAATFAMLTSIVAGLRESYRVVLASLGPKLFGLLCFFLATEFHDVSVWRVSSGIHGQPRDVVADMDRLVVVNAIWESPHRLTYG